MPTTLDLSPAELINELYSRGIMLEANGSKLRIRSRSTLTVADRLTICERKLELLRVLGNDVHAVQEVTRHQEKIPIPCFSTTVESWDERGIANLVAVARQAGFCLEYDSTGLTIEGPSTPTELRRLLREQAAGIARSLEIA